MTRAPTDRDRLSRNQDIVALSATALSACIHRRGLSCEEVLDAFLARIDAVNPQINALVDLQARDALASVARERDA